MLNIRNLISAPPLSDSMLSQITVETNMIAVTPTTHCSNIKICQWKPRSLSNDNSNIHIKVTVCATFILQSNCLPVTR